jgi:hypothetical protein
MVLHRLLCRLYHAKCANSLQTCPMTQVKVDDIVDNRIVTRERQNVGDDLHGPTRGPIQLGLACSDLFSTVPQASPQNLIEFG